MKDENHDKQFARFLEKFLKLHIYIPFAKTTTQMPKQANFLIEIISNKKKLEGFVLVKLNEECSGIVFKKSSPKLKNPGSLTIHFSIGNSYFEKVLCDLVNNLNLMHLSVLRKLDRQEPHPTHV